MPAPGPPGAGFPDRAASAAVRPRRRRQNNQRGDIVKRNLHRPAFPAFLFVWPLALALPGGELLAAEDEPVQAPAPDRKPGEGEGRTAGW